MSAGSKQLEDLWALTAGRPIRTAFRTAALDVETSQGPVLIGMDRTGSRCLLVPLIRRHTLREDLDGRAVVLRHRTLEDDAVRRDYAVLGLVDPRLTDLFTALCVEIVDRIISTPAHAVAALRKVLDDWRALLAGAQAVLTSSALAGLFAELHMLRRMLRHDPGAVVFWTGPTGSAQDFHRGNRALEVKTTTSTEGRIIQVHGVDQLEAARPGALLLHWSRLRIDRGESVPDLVTNILSMTDDAASFRQLLQHAGYRDMDCEVYTRRRFEVLEERMYVVGPGFPRITMECLAGDAVMPGVGSVQYTVDLDSAAAEKQRVLGDVVDDFMREA